MKKGFSLIELIVAMAIVTILATVAVPKVQSTVRTAGYLVASGIVVVIYSFIALFAGIDDAVSAFRNIDRFVAVAVVVGS